VLAPPLKDRILEVLDEMAAAHTTAALCAAEIRSVVSRIVGNRNDATISHVNTSTFSVEWDGKVCLFKDSLPFRLMKTLCRRPGQVFSFDQLLRHVWSAHSKSPDTIRSTVRHLKWKLEKAEMKALAHAVKARGHGYCLSLQ
jgi:DNA-binding response OmpR family regulator